MDSAGRSRARQPRPMNVLVFDPTQGAETTAAQKILFFHPGGTPLGDQIKVVGLVEALANFMKTFSAGDCESLHTSHQRHVYMQPEPNIWLALVVRRSDASTKPAMPAVKGKSLEEEELQDTCLQALLRRIYEGLRLACGPLRRIVDSRGIDGLRLLLAQLLPLMLKLISAAGGRPLFTPATPLHRGITVDTDRLCPVNDAPRPVAGRRG